MFESAKPNPPGSSCGIGLPILYFSNRCASRSNHKYTTGRGVEREQLAENQATHDGDAQGTPQLGARAGTQRQRQTAQQRGHRRHHDGTEAQQAGLKNCFLRRLVFFALGFESEVDHHDGVLFHDADQQNDSDQSHHSEIVAGKHESQDRAHARGGQRGENRNGMDVALVQNSQHDVHRDNGGENQEGLAGKRILKCGRRSLKCGVNARRQLDIFFRPLEWLSWPRPATLRGRG